MKTHRIFALALVLVLAAGLFAGCSQDSGGDASSSPAQSASAEPTAAAAETSEPETAPLPLCAELTEFEIWSPWALTTYSTFLSDWNDCLGFKLIERDTNVHIKWSIPAGGSENEDFQLLIASLDYPDAIEYFKQYYSKGIEDAVDNDIAIKLDNIVDMYMPNYKALIADEDTTLKVRTDSGYMGALFCICDTPEARPGGNGIRKDWLDNLGLEIPETYDELHDALTAFRDELGVESPMALDGAGVGGDNMMYTMSSGFGVIGDFFQRDGKVYYGPAMQEYTDYLTLMRDWYAEGLIDRDFTTRAVFGDVISAVFAGQIGYGWIPANVGTYDECNGAPADPNYVCVAVKNPVMNKGETTHFGLISEKVEGGSVITTACKDAQLLARWYDFQYGPQGFLYLNYGEEGNTYYIDSNGDPCLSGEGMEAYYGVPISTCMQATGGICHSHLRNLYKGRALRNADAGINASYIAAGEIWDQDTADWLISLFVSMTSEESSAYYAAYTDLNTYVDEISIKYILGAVDISAVDEMRAKVGDMGADTCTALKQASLDRFYARGSK